MAATIQRMPSGTESLFTASSSFDEYRGRRPAELQAYDWRGPEPAGTPLTLARESSWLEVCLEPRPPIAKWVSALLSSYKSLDTPSRESLSHSLQIERALTALKAESVSLPQVRDVREYLLEHPDMTDLVTSVCQMASDHIGPQAELSLEIHDDPEIEDEYLTLYVRQVAYDGQLLEAIRDVREQYLNDLSERSGWILVTTDFGAPKAAEHGL